jgi:hypothetical protein
MNAQICGKQQWQHKYQLPTSLIDRRRGPWVGRARQSSWTYGHFRKCLQLWATSAWAGAGECLGHLVDQAKADDRGDVVSQASVVTEKATTTKTSRLKARMR